MAPGVGSKQTRWQLEVKRGFGEALPPWTREDDDNDYDMTIMKRRKLRLRVRQDGTEVPTTEPNVAISVSRSARSLMDERAVAEESASDSDSAESGMEDMEDMEDSDMEEEDDATEVGVVVEDATTDTSAPALSAPTAEGSVSNDGELLKIADSDGVHTDVHKILLGVGSVGGFLLLVGIVFIAWKVYKKKSQKNMRDSNDDLAFDKPSRWENLVSKVPYIGSRFGHKGWYTIDAPSQDNFEKQQAVPPARSVSRRLDSQFFAPDKPMGVYRMASTRTAATNLEDYPVSPTSTMFVERTAVQVQVVARHDPKESVESLHSSTHSSTHKRVPSTTPYVYDVGGRRQTGVSELSSISSGFGDGDIVVTPTNNTIQTFRSLPSQPSATATNPSRQSTWRSNTTVGRRDTVSTTASMDVRPRFHSVNSWVKQQDKQLRHAQRQQESLDGAPPVPSLGPPPEQDFGMMMPDGERPRPVEMV